MTKQILFYLMLFLNIQVIGQNLVPNGDFEQFSSCPPSISCLDSALFWTNPSSGAQNGTPDYLNQCASPLLAGVPVNFILEGGSYQIPHSGLAYGGIYLIDFTEVDYREYIETPLVNPLSSNITYHLEFYISLASLCAYSSNSIQCYFSNTLIQGIPNYNTLPFTPQVVNMTTSFPDTTRWLLLSGNYTAQGGENFLIIGNFLNDINTSFIPLGTSLWNSTYVYIDDVTLTPLTSLNNSNPSTKINLFPNPFDNKLMLKGFVSGDFEIRIFNSEMMEMKRIKCIANTTIDTGDLKDGIYFYELRSQHEVVNGKLIKLTQK